MVYQGSKSKYKKYIVPILQETIDKHNVDTYIECFVGGANIIDSIKCRNRFGYDINERLIALLCSARDDFSQILTEGSREMWDIGKKYLKTGILPENVTLAQIGAIEFFSSYGAKGFPGGYVGIVSGRNFFKERRANLEKQAPSLKGITFKCQNYLDLDDVKNAVIYLDPPYKGTTGYNKKEFDHEKFWEWVRKISKDNFVFISEENAPDDFDVVWEMKVVRGINHDEKKKATEKLYTKN